MQSFLVRPSMSLWDDGLESVISTEPCFTPNGLPFTDLQEFQNEYLCRKSFVQGDR